MICYVEVSPSPDLRSWIACFWSSTGRIEAGRTVGNRVLPDGCIDVILRFGDSPRGQAAGLGSQSFFVGAMTSPSVVWQVGRVDVMGVRFRPGGATAFLGLPANELTDLVVGLDDVWADAAEFLERTVALRVRDENASPGDGARAVALTARECLCARARAVESLLRRRAIAQSRDPLIGAAVDLIEAGAGQLRMSAIEQRLGVTQRSLERWFLAHVGLTPKVASRIARFRAAAGTLRKDPAAPLAPLAVEHGYHDQAHLTREFRQFAALTPAAYARERRVGFVQDSSGPLV